MNSRGSSATLLPVMPTATLWAPGMTCGVSLSARTFSSTASRSFSVWSEFIRISMFSPCLESGAGSEARDNAARERFAGPRLSRQLHQRAADDDAVGVRSQGARLLGAGHAEAHQERLSGAPAHLAQAGGQALRQPSARARHAAAAHVIEDRA